MKKTLALLIISSSLVNGLEAQETKTKLNTWSIGANIGHIYDLPQTFFVSDKLSQGEVWGLNGDDTDLDIGFGFYVEKQLSPILGLQLGYDMGKVTGQNSKEYYEGEFSNISLTSTWNFTNFTKKREKSQWGFYALAGGSMINYDAKRYFVERTVDNNGVVQNLNNTESDQSHMKLHGGLGLRRHISSNFRVELESTYNTVFKYNFDAEEIEEDYTRDAYLRTTLGIAYTFGKGNSMHEVSNHSKEYFWESELASENVPTEENVGALVDGKLAGTKAEMEAAKAKLAALEDDLKRQKALLDKYQMEKSKTPETVTAIQAQVFNVYFATGSSYITDEYKKILVQLGTVLKDNKDLNATAIGFTDITGSESLNVKLRDARSEAVKSFLIENVGIDANRISTSTSTDNIEGNGVHHLNRKTDIIIK